MLETNIYGCCFDNHRNTICNKNHSNALDNLLYNSFHIPHGSLKRKSMYRLTDTSLHNPLVFPRLLQLMGHYLK